MRRGMGATVTAAVITAVVFLCVLLWGSSQGSSLISPPEGTWGPPQVQAPAAPPSLEELPAAEEGPLRPTESSNFLVDLAYALFLMSVLAAALILLRAALKRQRRDREARLAVDEDEELIALLDASGHDVRYRALAEADPRNGVVACWVALEESVHRSGLREDLSETAAELTSRVLGRWQVDQQAISDLSEAYREARFSRHPVTEEQRAAAVKALERIHADLQAKVKADAEAAEARAEQEQRERDQAESGEGMTSAPPPRSGR